jgi:hypothetical protein
MTTDKRKLWKLARPLLQGVVVEILSNVPTSKPPLRNRFVIDMLTGLPQFKGEVVIGKPEDPECKEITELFLDQDFIPHPFIFWVYDLCTTGIYDLQRRLTMAEQFVITCFPTIQYAEHKEITTYEELRAYAELVMEERKFPGIVLRDPWSTYGTEDETITSLSQLARYAN